MAPSVRIAFVACALVLGACEAPSASTPQSPASMQDGDEVGLVLGAYRPDDPQSDDLFRFEPDNEVETFDGDLARVHFTRSGPDAVRSNDGDGTGIPDAVEAVAAAYDEVLAAYAAIGFRPPVTDLGTPQGDGGDGRLDVYLIDFAGASDGAWVRERCELGHPRCSGYVVQENDFSGYGYPSYAIATRILASHELFHAVQAAYDANQGANWSEATAVWASERFDPSLSDLEHFADGWFESPDRSIDQEPTGPVDSFSYGLGIFAQYLYERFGDALHLSLWKAVEDGADGVADPHWLTALADLLARDFATTFADEWVTFATWALRSGHGDAGGPTFVNAKNLPEIATEREALPFSDDKLRVYPASLQVWSVTGGEVAVAIVSTEEGDTDGLVLVTGARKGLALTTRVRDGLEAAIDGTGNDEILIAVVNTNLAGNSKRPGLCLGSIAEVAACKAELAPVAEPGPETAEEVPEAGPEIVEEAIEESEAGPEVVEEAMIAEPAPTGGDDGCTGGGASWLGLLGIALPALRRRAGDA